ncbi:MAG: hypothetical protein ABI865_14030 [Nitrosospira sp.]
MLEPAFEIVLTSIQRDFGPELTATIHVRKPEITANEPAFFPPTCI